MSSEEQEQKVGGVEHRLLDGYDGGEAPPAEFVAELLESAPPEIKARAKEFAAEQAARAEKAEKAE
jgi:hypothetical protein